MVGKATGQCFNLAIIGIDGDSVTPMEMATGYTVIANGGHKVMPYFIEKIVNEAGKTIYQAKPNFACNNSLRYNLWLAQQNK